MPDAAAIHVKGLRELVAVFDRLPAETKKTVRNGLVEVGEPVRAVAQKRAAHEIRNVHDGDRWAGMRLGITRKLVYVAPAARARRGHRGRGSRWNRPNFGDLLMDRAMTPAMVAEEPVVAHRLEQLLDRLADHEKF